MIVYYKASLQNLLTLLSLSEHIISVKLLDNHVIFVYCPPWTYDDRSGIIGSLEETISSNDSLSKTFVLGDFNVRIGETNDLADLEYNFTKRNSQETCRPSHQHEIDLFLSFIRSNGLAILNGRFTDSLGEWTHCSPSGNSVIDYCLASFSALGDTSSFEISPHQPSLSDHRAIICRSSPLSTHTQAVTSHSVLQSKLVSSTFAKLIKTRLLPPTTNSPTELADAFNQIIIDATVTTNKKPCDPRRDRKNGRKLVTDADIEFLLENRNNLWKFISNTPATSGSTPSLEEFATHYKGLFGNNLEKPPPILKHNTDLDVSYPHFDTAITLEEIAYSLSETKMKSAPGMDGVSYKLITQNFDTLGPFLTNWFNGILTTGVYPQQWKTVLIKPCYKKGDPLDPGNYRPISLQSCIAKLFSKIIDKRMRAWLKCHHPLRHEQFGFQEKVGTIDAAYVLHNGLAADVDAGIKVMVAFVDFSNAFDTVDPNILLGTLVERGFPPKLTNLIKNMYEGCSGMVTLDHGHSNQFRIERGVKQGDPLSPLLFLLYIEPLIYRIDSAAVSSQARGLRIGKEVIRTLLYADDLAIFAYSKLDMERYLRTLHSFCNDFNLKVNTSKTKIMPFHKSSRQHIDIEFNGVILENVTEFKYLGVWLDSKLSYRKAHKEAIIKTERAIGIAANIFSNPQLLPINSIRLLYSGVILPQFTYGSEIWGSLVSKLSPDLHCRFLKRFLGLPRATSHTLLAKEIPLNPPGNAITVSALKFHCVYAPSSPNELVKEANWYGSQIAASCRNINHKTQLLLERLDLTGFIDSSLDLKNKITIIKVRCFQRLVIQPQRNEMAKNLSPPYSIESLRINAEIYFKYLGPFISLILLKLRTNSSLKPSQYKWKGKCPNCHSTIFSDSWALLTHLSSICPSPGFGHRSSASVKKFCSLSLTDLDNQDNLEHFTRTLKYLDNICKSTLLNSTLTLN